MNARDLMSTELTVVTPEMPVAAVAELLAQRGISGVPVIDANGAPVGMVTEGDLIRRLVGEPRRGPLTWFLLLFSDPAPLAQRFAQAHGKTARDVMSKDLVSVVEDAPAERIAELMEQRNVRRVLVLSEGRLVGLVSRADLLRAVLRASQGAGPTRPEPHDDAAILRGVLAAMREQPWADTFWVYPHVAGGVVTLHGFARSGSARDGLRVLAEEVPGVKSVVDRLDPMPLLARISR